MAVPAPPVAGHAAAAAAVLLGAGLVPAGVPRPGAPGAINTPIWLARGIVVLCGEAASAAPGWLIHVSLTIGPVGAPVALRMLAL